MTREIQRVSLQISGGPTYQPMQECSLLHHVGLTPVEPLKIPLFIDCEKGDLILPGLLGIMIASRETVFNQLVFHEMGKRGIFNGSVVYRHV